MRYFQTTARIGFDHWRREDGELAQLLWGDREVTRYISASGVFFKEDIQNRLLYEIDCQAQHGVQYWPIYCRISGDLIGCCGLHPHGDNCYELGFHLRPDYWRQGYATEAARAVIDYAFRALRADSLFAGHNPKNIASKAVLTKLGFQYTGDEYYPPTGLNHPSYILRRESMKLQTIEHNGNRCAVVLGTEKIITDVQSALDLLMSCQYEAGTKDIAISRDAITDDFFILSTGLAGEILQKFVNYGGRIAIYGDFSHFTSKPLRDFMYESNQGKDVFFVSSEEEAIDRLTGC